MLWEHRINSSRFPRIPEKIGRLKWRVDTGNIVWYTYTMRTITRINQQRRYVNDNRVRINEKSLTRVHSNLLTWVGFLPSSTNCQVCGCSVGFMNKESPIAFDHRYGGIESIKIAPTTWLGTHPRTPLNEKIWVACDFGILCKRCNGFLPTKNRKEFLQKAITYVTNS